MLPWVLAAGLLLALGAMGLALVGPWLHERHLARAVTRHPSSRHHPDHRPLYREGA